MRTRIIACEKFTYVEPDGSETVLFYKLPIGRLGRFIRPDAMPAFEGKKGFVEVMGPATCLHVLRQVEEKASAREVTDEERQAIHAFRKR